MPRTRTRKSSVKEQQPSVALPEHIQVSDAELAVLSRLVRVMRMKDRLGAYWLGPFIEWLLFLDVSDADLNYVNPLVIRKTLDEFGKDGVVVTDGSEFMRRVQKQLPGIRFASASLQKSGGDPSPFSTYLPQGDEDQFYEILRLWRQEYPEPPKRMDAPQGHLGRKDPDD